jgi:hypothetical protein
LRQLFQLTLSMAIFLFRIFQPWIHVQLHGELLQPRDATKTEMVAQEISEKKKSTSTVQGARCQKRYYFVISYQQAQLFRHHLCW